MSDLPILNPKQDSVVMHSGARLYWHTNAAGARTYHSDEVPTDVFVWDTALVSPSTLQEAMALEHALQMAELRAERLAARTCKKCGVVFPRETLCEDPNCREHWAGP